MQAASLKKPSLIIGGSLLVLGVALYLIVTFYLSGWLLGYVNRVLANMNGYAGHVESLDVDLLAGTYSINNLSIEKKDGSIPVPFFAVERLSFTVDWRSLLHGRILSKADLEKPVLNFAVSGESKQYGGEQDWTQVVKNLAPVDINRLTVSDGKITYRDFATNPKVDIDIEKLRGHVDNLRNVVDKNDPLPSVLDVDGTTIGKGHFHIMGKINILKPFPDMDLDCALTGSDITAFNSFPEAYAAFTFRQGTLDFYSHLTVKNDRVSGYVKPIITHLSIDVFKSSNPLIVTWDAIISAITTLLTNHKYDRFATKASLEGDLKNLSPNGWEALTNIFRNAFIQALQKGFSDLSVKPPAEDDNQKKEE